MYLNLIQVAESFGVSEKVVEGWMHNEGLPHMADRGRLLFDRAQVANWAASRGLAAHVGFLAPESPVMATGQRLESLLRTGGIWRDVANRSLLDLFERIVTALPGTTPALRELLARRLSAPGGITMAPVGGGFALPHPSMRVALGREAGVVAIIFLQDPLLVAEPCPDAVPITRLVFFIAPSPRAHLGLLGRLSRTLTRGRLRNVLLRGAADDEIFDAVRAADASAQDITSREVKS